jgi:hypothetical protein
MRESTYSSPELVPSGLGDDAGNQGWETAGRQQSVSPGPRQSWSWLRWRKSIRGEDRRPDSGETRGGGGASWRQICARGRPEGRIRAASSGDSDGVQRGFGRPADGLGRWQTGRDRLRDTLVAGLHLSLFSMSGRPNRLGVKKLLKIWGGPHGPPCVSANGRMYPDPTVESQNSHHV